VTVQAVEAFTPYSTVTAMFGGLPTWMNSYDAERITSYQVYEQIYWNVPETFKLVMRGEEDMPIYIPTARTIVDTTNRFLCPKPGFIVDPDIGDPADQIVLKTAFSRLMRRERFWSKFTANKRFGLIRGDWLWHITADPIKPAGSRISIEPLDPAAYFPVTHPDDPDRIIAVYIVEQFTDAEGDTFIKRQTYQKGADPLNNDGTDRTIYNSIALFDVKAWEDLADKTVEVIKEPTPLPPQITTIPIYHIPNMETPGDPFGSSELRGFERIMAGINQAVSDEEVILALEGMGMYATDGGPPRDDQGLPTDWILGPGRVVEHPMGTKFERVTGVTSVAPMQEHIKFLISALKEASATPDAATGKVDVTVAESGISLLMQLGPLLSKVDERGETVIDVHTQMYHDISQMWLPAYEQLPSTPCVTLPVYGDAIPENRDKKFTEIIAIFTNGLADATWAHDELAALGYDFPTDMLDKIVSEAQARARAVDPFASRMEGELGLGEDEIQDTGGA
jgi:hypothetical protein